MVFPKYFQSQLACTAATTLALGTSVGATQGPIVTVSLVT